MIGAAQLVAYLVLLLALAWPLGIAIARVASARCSRIERWLHRLLGVDPERECGWREYAADVLLFHALGIALLVVLQMTQHLLPLNPAGLGPVVWHTALNMAISFVTNTNWQSYSGETTMSPLTQMAGLAVQNFVSAGTGMAILLALVRGLVRGTSATIGSFWVDLVRMTLLVLVPLSAVLALFLVVEGVPQTLAAGVTTHALDGGAEQTIALGPVASQVAIKQLGTNGGGYFNVNSAHPLENPTALSNLLELLAILLIPAALCVSFGRLVGDARQGRVLLGAMLVIFVPLALATILHEAHGNPALIALGADAAGGNMEGKEARFGAAGSALWAVATTAASNGSVNAMHDSFMPLGGLWPLWLMQLGEVVFGGVGSGLYGMVLFAFVTVFIAGLMVGRTPEYLGKKIEAKEIKMAALAILAPSVAVLLGSALAVTTAAGRAGPLNAGAHGFAEILYAFSSAANNNGSAFAGLTASTPFYDLTLGLCMLVGRFAVALPVLAMAGSLAAKRRIPPSAGTLPTHGALFLALLVAIVLLCGALTFLPALALGPIVEQLGGPR